MMGDDELYKCSKLKMSVVAAKSSFLFFYALETPNICFMHDACDISRYVIGTVSSLTVDRFI